MCSGGGGGPLFCCLPCVAGLCVCGKIAFVFFFMTEACVWCERKKERKEGRKEEM